MWSVVVALPAVQAEFAVARGGASLPFTLTTIGFGVGGVLMGRVSDRFGIVVPVLIGRRALGVGYVLASMASSLWAVRSGVRRADRHVRQCLDVRAVDGGHLALVRAAARHRGRVVRVRQLHRRHVLAAGGGVPDPDHGLADRRIYGSAWCAWSSMVPLTLLLRAPAPVRSAHAAPLPASRFPGSRIWVRARCRRCSRSPGLACCVAMSMPQVHIVAYCGDLGYGVANGARMLSLMMACGIVSRVASGFIADRRRRHGDLGDRLGGADDRAELVSDQRRAGVAVRDLRDVRAVPGRPGAQLRDRDPGEFSGNARRDARRLRHDDDACSAWLWAAGCRGRFSI